MRQFDVTLEFQIIDLADEEPVMSIELDVGYDVKFGEPPSGLSGPPEHYDPGSGDEIDYGPEDLTFYEIGKGERTKIEMPKTIVDSFLAKIEDHEDYMIEKATGD